MRRQDFSKLTPAQQITLLIAMHVRNQMEDFHIDNLSDAQMKQLNPIIRQAIFDIISFTNTPPTKGSNKERVDQFFDWLITIMPDYWEIPEKTSLDFNLPKSSSKKTKD
jgi:hypothetical protein